MIVWTLYESRYHDTGDVRGVFSSRELAENAARVWQLPLGCDPDSLEPFAEIRAFRLDGSEDTSAPQTFEVRR